MNIALSLLLAFSLSAYTQEDEDTLLELEVLDEMKGEISKAKSEPEAIESSNPYNSVLNDLEKLNRSSEEIKLQARKDLYKRNRRFIDYKYYLDLQDVIKSPLFKATIKKGTVIYSVPDNKRFSVPKDIYVWAHAVADSEHYIYILDKQYQIKYKAYVNKVHNVEDVANLDVPPTQYIEVDHEKKYKPQIDDVPHYVTLFKLHMDYLVSKYTSDLVNQEEGGQGFGFRLSGSSLYKFSLPFDLGATIEYENTSFSLQNSEKATRYAVSVGPTLRWHPILFEKKQYFISMSFLTSLASKISGTTTLPNQEVSLASNSFDLSIAVSKNNRWGQFFWGGSFKRSWLTAKANQGNISINDTSKVDDSLGVFIGQEF